MDKTKKQYLVKWYPVHPWDDLRIIDLDILHSGDEETTYNAYKEEAKIMFDGYVYAGRIHGLDKYGKVGYNNSWWWVIEAENAFEAASIVKERIDEEKRDHQKDELQ